MLTQRSRKNILVLGAGNFGTCLAQHLAEKGYSVTIWSRSAEVVESINTSNKNPKYLSTIILSGRISATDKVNEDLIDSSPVIVLAVPSQSLRQVLTTHIKPFFREGSLLVGAAKGIEVETLALPTDVVHDVLGAEAARKMVALSGPSFASEVVRHQPSAVSAASLDPDRAQWAQEVFHAPHFRVYTSNDPTGLEVAGALKNVIAIAAGAAEGIGYQANSRAALLTRGLAEITRIGVKLGANPLTFTGLGGVGDLFLTCTSEKSRNFSVGFRLGRGEPLRDVLGTMDSVAEGVATSKSAYQLARKFSVDAPIIGEIYQVLYESKPITQAVVDLLTRDAKPELSLPLPPYKAR